MPKTRGNWAVALDRIGAWRSHGIDPIAMTAPVDAIPDPILALEACLHEQSDESMASLLRDVWHVVCRHQFDGRYHEGHHLLMKTGRCSLSAGINEPVMIRLACRPEILPAVPAEANESRLGVHRDVEVHG